MFRRRSAGRGVGAATSAPPQPVTAQQLEAAGWVLPKGIAAAQQGREPAWTLVGTVGSPTATPVDPAGLVVGDGWSVDWWIGGDDRWHVPAREPAVRQDLLADAPVVETRVRIPGGDAVHRAYGVRSPRATGDEWVVVEVENQTPVPLAVALVVRPLVADAVGSASEITIEPVDGGSGRDQAHLVRVDGAPVVVLPRRPARVQAGNGAEGDAVALVTTNEAGAELTSATCPDGLATLALLFPVPHTAVLRAVVPVGDLDASEAIAYPGVIPDAATVAAGWEIHRRGPRLELPERRLQTALARARTHLLLAHDGTAVRRDGAHEPDVDPGATDVLLHAFDLVDRPEDVVAVVARWQERLAVAPPSFDALALAAVAQHWLLHRDDPLRDWLLPEVAAAVERLDRADRCGQLADPDERQRAQRGLALAATMLAASEQRDSAAKVASLAARLAPATGIDEAPSTPVARLAQAGDRLGAGDPAGYDQLLAAIGEASLTGAWTGPGRSGRGLGHDLAASAALVQAVRALLVTEVDDGLQLLPVFPPTWYGAGVELHDAPTAFGHLSFAIRWHGQRPALLWDLERHPDVGTVTVRVPGLDPTWSTTEARGDALLGEVAPPEGIDLIREVAEHPDIDPAMRKPGADPGAPPPTLPEGGTFS